MSVPDQPAGGIVRLNLQRGRVAHRCGPTMGTGPEQPGDPAGAIIQSTAGHPAAGYAQCAIDGPPMRVGETYTCLWRSHAV